MTQDEIKRICEKRFLELGAFLKQTFWNKLICCCLNNTNITTPSLCKGWRDSQ